MLPFFSSFIFEERAEIMGHEHCLYHASVRWGYRRLPLIRHNISAMLSLIISVQVMRASFDLHIFAQPRAE